MATLLIVLEKIILLTNVAKAIEWVVNLWKKLKVKRAIRKAK